MHCIPCSSQLAQFSEEAGVHSLAAAAHQPHGKRKKARLLKGTGLSVQRWNPLACLAFTRMWWKGAVKLLGRAVFGV